MTDRTAIRISSLGLSALLAVAGLAAGCQGPAVQPARQPQAREDAEASPTVTLRPPLHHEQSLVLGESVQGRPLDLYVFGEGGPTTLVLGGIHGNEPTSSDVAVELIRYLQDHPEAYEGHCVMIAPAVNPDGLAARRRTNANGIDINRNFPAANFPRVTRTRFAGGPKPLSEPETRAIMDAVEHARPARIISIHSIPRGRHGNYFDGPARALAEEMGRHNRYAVLPTMGYDTPGSLGSWAGVDRGIPIITLELPRDADGDTCWRENRAALLAAIRFAAAPSVDPVLLGK